MAIDISQYLEVIAGNGNGEEVAIAIHNASLLLGTEMYKTADIDELLDDIKSDVFGKDLRMDIYEILKRLSEVPAEGGNGIVNANTSIVPGTYGHFYISSNVPCGEATLIEE